MASGEQVLAQSIGLDAFTRDSANAVQEADALCRPYVVQDQRAGVKVNLIFRDLRLSDLVGFEYSNQSGEAAAPDLMQRLENIRQQLKTDGATRTSSLNSHSSGRFRIRGVRPAAWRSRRSTCMSIRTPERAPARAGCSLVAMPRSKRGSGWDVALWAEGWTPQIHAPGADGQPKQLSSEFKVLVDPAAQTATLRVPREVFGADFDPVRAGYLGIVMSQDGFPAQGVWRVRDVLKTAEQWKLGGAPDNTNHTRVIDAAIPAEAIQSQEVLLSTSPSFQEPRLDALTPDDFPQLPVVPAQPAP
ncbi:MAG TPA: glucodextranase DOMON-like domain-containing protein [Anaerolineae bacterium]|nr:glucodextranase DOMON-like domain-containing protein [Anaerolineae bacterium]